MNKQTVNSTGVKLIAKERARQIAEEECTDENDDRLVNGELVQAASAYQIFSPNEYCAHAAQTIWPWSGKSWKPSNDPIRNLVKAGALIAAEIDRLNRAKAKGTK